MSLIRCPECGNEISSTAAYCIHCGYNLESYQIVLSNLSGNWSNALGVAYKRVFGSELSEAQMSQISQNGVIWSGSNIRQAKEFARKISKSIGVVIKDRNQCYVSFGVSSHYTALFIIAALLIWIFGIIASISIASLLDSGSAFFVSAVFFFSFGAVVYGIGEIVNALRTVENVLWNLI